MVSDVGHSFSSVHSSSKPSGTRPFMSFVHFLIGFFFLINEFESSFYILDSPLSDTSLANILSQYVACLFIIVKVSITENKFLI